MRGLRSLSGVLLGLTVAAALVGCDSRPPEPTLKPSIFDPGPAAATGNPRQTVAPYQTSKPRTRGTAVELRQALADGEVRVTGTGDGLQRLDLEIESRVSFDLEVTIEAGTLLEPRARGTQQMVVVEGQTVSLAPRATLEISLDVACAEMRRDQPGSRDTFRVLDEGASGDLARLLATPEFRDHSGRVQQFAVWTITNNPRRNAYVGLTSGFSVFGSGPTDEELLSIAHLLDTADIDIGKYRALR